MIKIGALWFQDNGKVLSGSLGDAIIVAMPCPQKSEKSPAYELYIKEAVQKAYAPAVKNYAPQSANGADFRIEIGKKYAGKMASEVPREDLIKSIQFFEKDGPPRGKALDFVNKAKAFLNT